MGNVPATDDIAKGDIVVTAGGFGKGLESQFPKNIVIGTIIEVHRDPASIVSYRPGPAGRQPRLVSSRSWSSPTSCHRSCLARRHRRTSAVTRTKRRATRRSHRPAVPPSDRRPHRSRSADPAGVAPGTATTHAGSDPVPRSCVLYAAPWCTRPHHSALRSRTRPATADRVNAGCQRRTAGAPWGHPTRDHAGMDKVASHKRACVQ